VSFAGIKKLKEFIKILQESGEVSLKTRMEVGKAIAALQKERTAARTMEADMVPSLKLFESSYEGLTSAGPGWHPPWEWKAPADAPKVQNPRAYDINLHRGGYQAI
jgi:hypothetical protein